MRDATKKYVLWAIATICVAGIIVVTTLRRDVPETRAGASSVILFIGDGMGVGQISAAEIVLGGSRTLVIPTATVTGLIRTSAANALVTDSAASGTAMATGFKTDRGVVGELPDGTTVRNLFEAARSRGLAVGVITTSGLVDATPASFTVHASNRHSYREILTKMLARPFEVMIGGDFTRYPLALDSPGYLEALAAAEQMVLPGTPLVRTAADLEATDGPIVALLPPRPEMPEHHGPPLAVTLRKALHVLVADPDGFILMVESEVTDEMGHANNLEGIVQGIAELDEAVEAALDFTRERTDTLVLVTADHDTGGLGITAGTDPDNARASWASGGHTAQWVPVFAWGDGAENFAGVFENTDLGPKIGELLRLEDYPSRDLR